VNGRKVNIPSYQVRVDDLIEIKERSRKMARIHTSLETSDRRPMVSWLEMDKKELKGTVKAEPVRDELTLPINEQLIVELYSK
jgi:small subunit ribosomal protein S4